MTVVDAAGFAVEFSIDNTVPIGIFLSASPMELSLVLKLQMFVALELLLLLALELFFAVGFEGG